MDKLVNYLKKWQNGEEPGPYILDINPSDNCNLNCISCWQRNKKFDGKLNSKVYELSDKRILKLIDEAHELDVKKIEITGGGEPLTRNIIPEMIKKIKGYNIYGSLTTNGTLFTEKLIGKVIDLKWDKIVFSIDGIDETQDKLRGRKNTFEKNKKALLLFKKIKKQNKSSLPIIHFNSVISKHNYKELDKITLFGYETGCKAVNFETLTVHSEKGLSIKLNREEQKEFQNKITKIKKLAEQKNIKTNIEKFHNLELIENSNHMDKIISNKTNKFSEIPCYEPWYHLVVKVDGSVGPCCVFTEKKVNVKTKSLKQIWYGRFFRHLRKKIKKGKLPDYCKICNAGQLFRNEFLRKKLNKK